MPNRFQQIGADSDLATVVAALNKNFQKIDNEGLVKTFSGPNGTNSQIQGRLPYGGYGSLYYHDDEARCIIGDDPDGEFNIHVSKPGSDLLSLF